MAGLPYLELIRVPGDSADPPRLLADWTQRGALFIASGSIGKPRMGRRHKTCHVCGKNHAPWFVSAKRLWVLSVPRDDGKPGYRQQGLSKDHDEALAKWHQLEAGVAVVVKKATTTKPTAILLGNGEHNGENMRVGQLVNLFLDNYDPEGNPHPKVSPERFRLGKGYLDDLCSYMGNDTVSRFQSS